MEDPASDTKPQSPSLEKSPAAQGKEPTHLKRPWMSSKDGSGQSQLSHPEKLLENTSPYVSLAIKSSRICSAAFSGGWRREQAISMMNAISMEIDSPIRRRHWTRQTTSRDISKSAMKESNCVFSKRFPRESGKTMQKPLSSAPITSNSRLVPVPCAKPFPSNNEAKLKLRS